MVRVRYMKGKMLELDDLSKKVGSAGIWTRDLLHPKQESYP